MNALSVEQTYVIEERFEKAVKLIRSALELQELSIAAEIDLDPHGEFHPGERSRLLLVDSPLLLFEALALDRAAGVFFPLHVLVSGDGDQTNVSCVELASRFDLRLPPGSSRPLEALRDRIAIALESIPHHGAGA